MIKVLLVEDNEMNRDMLSRRLERRDFTVITANDGASAVDAARTHHPDIVLMDMELPIKDGWTATREIKLSVNANMPVIALTAHALSGDKEKAMAAGCDAYATKPVDFTALVTLIDQLTNS